ncbi:MAG: pitrilysin family protein [Candidatus Woesearchaeota archaeon]
MTKKRMDKTIIIGAIVILAVVVASYFYFSPATLVDVPLTALQEELDITKLPNGMLVTIKEQHVLPLVTIQFWIHTGMKNEPEERRGIAHIFEHIWFKGTATQEVGSFHKRVESLGGELNAMTAHDWTMYYVTVPSDKFNYIFPYMVDLLLNPAFNETEIQKELEVVVEEQRFSFNEPERFLDDNFALLLIDKHPYRHPVIGYKDTILGTTKEDLVEFYNTWYVPNNMNIVIVGDVNRNEILKSVTEAFANFEPRPLPQLELPKEEPIKTPRYKSSLKDIGFTYIATGYFGPNATDPDRYAMTVLNTIFSGGESSRLQRILKQEKSLITRGSSVFVPLNDMGVFEAIIVVDPEKAGAAKAELLLQLNRFKIEMVTDEELARAKRTILADRVRSHEEIFQVGFDIGQAWIDGRLDDYENILSHINAVTKEDIKKVANKYFGAYTMYELKPKL